MTPAANGRQIGPKTFCVTSRYYKVTRALAPCLTVGSARTTDSLARSAQLRSVEDGGSFFLKFEETRGG
jgi:hypothetical protein